MMSGKLQLCEDFFQLSHFALHAQYRTITSQPDMNMKTLNLSEQQSRHNNQGDEKHDHP